MVWDSDCLAVKNADGKWSAKNIITGEALMTETFDSIEFEYDFYNFMVCRNDADADANYAYSYKIYSVVSKTVIAEFTSTETPSFDSGDFYVDGEEKDLITIRYTATKDATEVTTLYFIQHETDKFEVYTYEAVDASKVSESIKVEVGKTYSELTKKYAVNKLYESSNKPADKDLDGYYMTGYEGTVDKSVVLEFYKDSKKKSTLALNGSNSVLLGFCGTYAYYTVSTPVAMNADEDYNLLDQNIYTSSSSSSTTASMVEQKVNMQVYKFNIKNGKTSEVKMKDYIYTELEPIYNYKTQSYDAFIATGYKANDDGVAQTTINPVYHVVDKNFKIIADFTNMPFNFEDIDCKLTDNRFLVVDASDCYIVDSKLNILASYELYTSDVDIEVYSDIQLLTINGQGNISFAVDFDGKAVLANKYENLNFNGGKAYTAIYDEDGKLSDDCKFVDVNTPDGTDAITIAENETCMTDEKGIIIVRNEDEQTCKIYNYNKTLLLEVKNVTSSKNFRLYSTYEDAYFAFLEIETSDNGTQCVFIK